MQATTTKSVSLISLNIQDLKSVKEIALQNGFILHPDNTVSLNLHANILGPSLDLSHLNALTPSLRVLDLSSNNIARIIEGALWKLSELKSLNLANNQIRTLPPLSPLQQLSYLNLAHNQISTLSFLVNIPSLHVLDLKCNKIEDVRELSYLASCYSLKHLILKSSNTTSHQNPITNQPLKAYRASVFQVLPSLYTLDEFDVNGTHVDGILDNVVEFEGESLDIYRKALLDDDLDVDIHMLDGRNGHVYNGNAFHNGYPHPTANTPHLHGQHEMNRSLINANMSRQMGNYLAHTNVHGGIMGTHVMAHREQQATPQINTSPSRIMKQDVAVETQEPPAQPVLQHKMEEEKVSAVDRLEKQLGAVLELLMQKQSSNEQTRTKSPKKASKKENTTSSDVEEESQSQVEENSRSQPENTEEEESKESFHDVAEIEEDEDVDDIPVYSKSKNQVQRSSNSTTKLPSQETRKSGQSGKQKASEDVASSCKSLTNRSITRPGKPPPKRLRPDERKQLVPNEAKALIKRLEEEEQRLLQRDQEFQSKISELEARVTELHSIVEEKEKSIASLDEQLNNTKTELDEVKGERENVQKEVAKRDEVIGKLKEKLDLVADANRRLKAEWDKTKLQRDETDQKINKLKEIVDQYQLQAQNKDNEVSHYKSVVTQLESTITTKDNKIQALEQSIRDLEVNTAKEVEVYKVRLEASQGSVTQLETLKMENMKLHHILSLKEDQNRREMDAIRDRCKEELKQAVEETERRMKSGWSQEVDTLKKLLTSARDAYRVLEEQYRNAVKSEESKLSDLKNAYSSASQKLAEQAELLSRTSQREGELQNTIRELNRNLTEQKAKVRELEERCDGVVAVYEEKLSTLEEKSKSSSKLKADLKQLQKENEALRSDLDSKHAGHSSLIRENEQLKNEVVNLTNSIKLLKSHSESQTQSLKTRVDALEKELEQSMNAVKVKNKMLDDQNETIKNLKTNLEAKIREYHSVINEFEKKERDWEDRLKEEGRSAREWEREIESQEKFIQHLQISLDDQKAERDTLRNQLSLLSQKLRDRNSTIAKIEEEVSKVTDIYKAKEAKLREEYEKDIADRELKEKEMKKVVESCTNRVFELEKEKENYDNDVKSLESENEKLKHENQQLESEMKVLLVEMDKQKKKLEAKIRRIREAVQE